MKTKYLIIGNGIAALSAAKEIRKHDKKGDLIMATQESTPTYYRIKLTEAIASDEDAKKLLVEGIEFYDENNIRLMLDTETVDIDYDKQVATTRDGTQIEYEKLLLATGSKPFVPKFKGAHKLNIYTVRTIENLMNLRTHLPDIADVLVVGGGLLGLEAAHSLQERFKDVHVAEFADHLLSRQLDEEMSIKLEDALQDAGLHIHTGVSLDEVVGFNKVLGARLSDGSELDVDAVLFSVGIRSNIDLAKGKLATDKGIQVNESLVTENPNVWAAGDCAEVNGITMGLWTASNEMGKIAGANMSGGDEKYDLPKQYTSLKIGDVSLFSAGTPKGDDTWEEENDGNIEKLIFQDGKTVGGILFGSTKKMGKINKLVQAKTPKDEAIEELKG